MKGKIFFGKSRGLGQGFTFYLESLSKKQEIDELGLMYNHLFSLNTGTPLHTPIWCFGLVLRTSSTYYWICFTLVNIQSGNFSKNVPFICNAFHLVVQPKQQSQFSCNLSWQKVSQRTVIFQTLIFRVSIFSLAELLGS